MLVNFNEWLKQKKLVNTLNEVSVKAQNIMVSKEIGVKLTNDILEKYPEGSNVDKATANKILKMYKDIGLDNLDAPLKPNCNWSAKDEFLGNADPEKPSVGTCDSYRISRA